MVHGNLAWAWIFKFRNDNHGGKHHQNYSGRIFHGHIGLLEGSRKSNHLVLFRLKCAFL